MDVNAQNAGEVARITKALAEPFDSAEVKWKPQMVKGNRALAMAYIDSRCVMDRLDEAVGIDDWRDEYKLLDHGEVECRLSVRIGGEWITKADVGSPSEQPDGGDRMKAAYSDALKRAAVKWGIGRFLYRLPAQWLDYDPVKKQFVATPQLPDWCRTGPAAAPKGGPKSDPKMKAQANGPANALPVNGEELHRRLQDKDAKLAAAKQSQPGALLSFVTRAGVDAGYPAHMTEWTGPAIAFAVDAAKKFIDMRPAPHANGRQPAAV